MELRLHGDIDLNVPGGMARLTGLRFERLGEMRSRDGSFTLVLEGRLDELRKVADFSVAMARRLAAFSDHDPGSSAVLTLSAPPAILSALADAALAMREEADADDYLANDAWAKAAFSFASLETQHFSVAE